MTCLHFSFTRILEDKAPVLVNTYIFPNNDRTNQLTISYHMNESEFWKADLDNALKSFRITNIK